MSTTINTEALKNIATTLAELSAQISALCSPKVTVSFKCGASQTYENEFALRLFKTNSVKLDIDHKDMYTFLLGKSRVSNEIIKYVIFDIDQSCFTEDGHKELVTMVQNRLKEIIPLTCAFIKGSSDMPDNTCLNDLGKFGMLVMTSQDKIILESLLNFRIKSSEIADIARIHLVSCLGSSFVKFVKDM